MTETHEERVHRLLNHPKQTTSARTAEKFAAEWKRKVAADKPKKGKK